MIYLSVYCLLSGFIKASKNRVLNEHHHDYNHIHRNMKIANYTYDKVLPCLLSAWSMVGRNRSDFIYPHDAEVHYLDIFQRTEHYRNIPIHEDANYEGPWIENQFVNLYSKLPLTHFKGFIPIFVQWIDTQILRGRHFDNLLHILNSVLRHDVLYLTISQVCVFTFKL
jgi:hypothetical protein